MKFNSLDGQNWRADRGRHCLHLSWHENGTQGKNPKEFDTQHYLSFQGRFEKGVLVRGQICELIGCYEVWTHLSSRTLDCNFNVPGKWCLHTCLQSNLWPDLWIRSSLHKVAPSSCSSLLSDLFPFKRNIAKHPLLRDPFEEQLCEVEIQLDVHS